MINTVNTTVRVSTHYNTSEQTTAQARQSLVQFVLGTEGGTLIGNRLIVDQRADGPKGQRFMVVTVDLAKNG